MGKALNLATRIALGLAGISLGCADSPSGHYPNLEIDFGENSARVRINGEARVDYFRIICSGDGNVIFDSRSLNPKKIDVYLKKEQLPGLDETKGYYIIVRHNDGSEISFPCSIYKPR